MLISPKDKLLIVAPHPDDEVIGCGGLLFKYGEQIDIMVLTDGRKGYLSTDNVDEEQLVIQRENELRAMAGSIGVKNINPLRIPDGSLKENKKRVMQENISGYSMIFVPNRYERQKDHCVVMKIFQSMVRKQRVKCILYEYEVWSPLRSPTDYIDISDIMTQKEKLTQFYKSQLKYVDYTRMTVCLNGYRGAGQKVMFAEAYARVPNISLAKRIYRILPHSFRIAIHKYVKCLVKR